MKQSFEYGISFIILIITTTFFLRKTMKNSNKTIAKDILLFIDIISSIKFIPILLFVFFMIYLRKHESK